MLVLQTRIFADHYQFYIHDLEYDHYDDSRLNWTDGEKLDYGYMARVMVKSGVLNLTV